MAPPSLEIALRQHLRFRGKSGRIELRAVERRLHTLIGVIADLAFVEQVSNRLPRGRNGPDVQPVVLAQPQNLLLLAAALVSAGERGVIFDAKRPRA